MQWLLIGLLVSFAPPSLAEKQGKGPHHQRPEFADIDLNGDGNVDEAEFYEARGQRIAERSSEGRALKNLEQAPAFGEIDTDGSGTISEAEFAHHQAQRQQQQQQQQQ